MTPGPFKIWIVSLLAGILVSGAGEAKVSTEAHNPLKQWAGFGIIESKGEIRYKSVYLNERIYQYASPDLADLRVVDSKGAFVPYLLQSGYPKTSQSQVMYDVRLIKSFRKKTDFIFDYRVIPENLRTDVVGNILQINLPEREFYKEVDVFGSYDGIRWDPLGHQALYRVDNLIKSDIPLPGDEKYTFYRITVLNNAENIELGGMQLYWETQMTEWAEFQRSDRLSYRIKHVKDTTRIIVENPCHLKIKGLDLTIGGNFKREYQVFEGTAKDSAPVSGGTIYQLQFNTDHVADTAIDLSGNPSSASRLVVEIKNYDDPPLAIQNIQTKYFIDRLVFEDKGSGPYRIYFGNPKARKPFYDMETYRSPIENEKTDLLAIKGVKIVKTAKMGLGQSPDYKFIFNIVIGAVAVLLIALLIGKLNKNGEDSK